jgi:hypothetical protein
MILHATEVFTPNDTPLHTYVQRKNSNFEDEIRKAFQIPKMILSVSGPSKSGKTVLVEKAIGRDNIIKISGIQIDSPDKIWELALSWIGAPLSRSTATASTDSSQKSANLGVRGKIPLVGEITSGGGVQSASSNTVTDTNIFKMGGMKQVADEIANSDFVLFVDDFHYIKRELQNEVAKQLKAGAEQGIRICVASVPHRSDDVVRANSELRGRVMGIDVGYWQIEELIEIGLNGFRSLNFIIDGNITEQFAIESCGSPQLMQSICLQFCFTHGRTNKFLIEEHVDASNIDIDRVLQAAAAQCDYSSLLDQMHRGPKSRGQERKEFSFVDGSRGDVYRCVLLAIKSDPATLIFPYAELTDRIQRVCIDESPIGSSYSQACQQISSFALAMYPEQRIIEWDEDNVTEVLNIVDPYFMFYIRSSKKIKLLGNKR